MGYDDNSSLTRLTLTLIRGLPGSGKSTLARRLINESTNQCIHLEADMFFVDAQGEYFFQPYLLKQAHSWCQNECKKALKNKSSVIVSNTFIKHWEMTIYQQFAVRFNAELIIKTCEGEYGNVHGVPASTVNKMRKQWEK
jgi:predicted kinase